MAAPLSGTSRQNAIHLDSSPAPAAMDISNAPEDILRVVLVALCQDPRQEKKAKKYISQLNERRQWEDKFQRNASATTTDGSRADKVVPQMQPSARDKPEKRAGWPGVSFMDPPTENSGDVLAQDDGSHKRKAGSAVHVCTQCDEVFQEDENSPKACQYHPGYLGVNYDSDVWDDWHEHMEQDTQENRDDYPEGFVWDCCDEDGLSEGCTRGWHAAPIPRARRADR